MTAVDERATEGTGPTRRQPWWLAPARWWREILVIVIGYGVYTVIQHHLNVSPAPAYRNAAALLALEHRLGIAAEHPLNQLFAAHAYLATAANCWYVAMHEAATPAVLLWIFIRRRAAYPYARFLLVVPTLLGFVLYYVVPVAPPRLLPGLDMIDTMARYPGLGDYSTGAMSHTAAQYAAFPSLHLAWALWSGAMVCWLARHWCIRVLAICYPVGTALVVLGTANHYVLDLVGGVLVTAFGVWLLWLLQPAGEPFRSLESATDTPGA
ncbi:phosphatase PAP2 family protein [Actinocatenispora rupis]|uniref:Inositol phosphorylceramide synthase n=1 Tax=Actinocatenispora rupis TaxID=519421 RepID=A0A8J3NDP6_9ACTN|nr:phosphatase PAP2 family protein [Actinocatenispora rupis]GID13162.1 inositol phosphorylceramide synthase [Actinocatenispora rupis]